LNGAGTQVSGPTFSNSICISIAGGSSPGDAFTPTSLTPGPEGKLFLSCDNNAYVQCGRQVLIDKSTLTATTYATTTAYFGSPAADAGCYSSALGRGILLDTFSDAVRAFAQGSVGEGSIVVQGGLVSSSGGSAENTDILEIPYGVFGGLANFGTGSPGCNGPQVMGASSIPSPGNASFRLTTLACPPNSLGLGLATNSPDLFGSDPFALGVKLHVDLFAATEIYSFDVNSNVFGLGLTVAPVAISPAIVGNTYYAQSLWAWTGCTANPPFNLSTSNGLAVTIQP
jgi:hypothetical protein